MLQALAVRGLPPTLQGGDVADAVPILELRGHPQAAVALTVKTQTCGHANSVLRTVTSSGSRFLRMFLLPPHGVDDHQSMAVDTVWAELGVH